MTLRRQYVLEIINVLLVYLEWAERQLDTWILINQLFMQVAEWLILLIHSPCFIIEIDLHYILSICSMISGILFYYCLADVYANWYLEEMRPWKSVFVAVFHMVNEDFSWEEDCAELALHWLWVLKYSLEDLYIMHFLLQLLILCLYFSYSIR
jgi:hypothetical protein